MKGASNRTVEQKTAFTNFINEKGQGMVEYGLIIALAVIVVIAAIALFGDSLTGIFTRTVAAVSGIS